MSNVTAKAPTRVVEGVVEQVNKSGVKISGTWYDYGYTFKGHPLQKEDEGVPVSITLVDSQKSGKSFIRAIEKQSSEEESTTESPTASTEALAYAYDLASKQVIDRDKLELIALIRFKKVLTELTRSEVSDLIVFLGGYTRNGRKRNSKRS